MSAAYLPDFAGRDTSPAAERVHPRKRRRSFRLHAPLGEPADLIVPIEQDVFTEAGDLLPDASIGLRRYGRRAGPIVLVMGGISSTRFVSGGDGWWSDVVKSGGGVDLNRFSVLGIDFAPNRDIRVRLSPRTQARLIEIALEALKIDRLHAIIGASYGGLVGLAFAALAPQRIERLCVISAAHRQAPLAMGWRGVQRRIVEFGLENNQAMEGMSLARQLAMLTYRSTDELSTRFHCTLGQDGKSDLDRYLVARGCAYLQTMTPKRWLSLSESIDRTNITPEAVHASLTLVGCTTDPLVPFDTMQELARRAPRCSALHELTSLYGHDAFLKEPRQLNDILRSFLTAESTQ